MDTEESPSFPSSTKPSVALSAEEENRVWSELNSSFSKVQKILDENRVLIGEINQNHESKMPENLTRNVTLIKELNSNISQVVDLYSDMSTSFVDHIDTGALDDMNGTNSSNDAEATAGSTGQKRARPS